MSNKNLSTDVRKSKRKAKNIMLLSSLSYLVLGIIMVVLTSDVKKFFCYALGAALTIYGLFNIITFLTDKENRALILELIVGVFSTGLGIFSFTVGSSFGMIIKIIGVLIVVSCIVDIKNSFALKKYGTRKWWISALITLLVIILAAVVVLFTSFLGDAVIVILGLILIYEGISGIAMKFILGHFEKKFYNDSNMIDTNATDR